MISTASHVYDLHPVYPVHPAFMAPCLDCGALRDSRDLWADRNGPAFRAYYCPRCAVLRGALDADPNRYTPRAHRKEPDPMNSHTPGPWRAFAYSVHGARRPSWCVESVQELGAPGVCLTAGPQGEANARLIAAAPDMLDALREIQDRLLWNPQDTRGDLLGYIKDAQDTLSAILAKLED